MKFVETSLSGVYVVDLERVEDERGFFARSWCQQEFADHGLNPRVVQCNISFNERRGTLRGMHYQAAPHEEAKLVRCTLGAIFDVIVDLRPGSSTYCRWFGLELSAKNRTALYVPENFAHGFQTLEDNSEVFYQMSESYHLESARGIRWNDPTFRISWPISAPIISKRDCGYADFAETKDCIELTKKMSGLP